jgi:hypothetical protein
MKLHFRQLATALGVVLASACLGLLALPSTGAQRAADYRPPAFQPRFDARTSPKVVIDGGHREMHTMEGGYATLATLLRADGLRVRALTDAPVSRTALEGIDVLVVSNARPPGEAEDALASDAQAFADAEVDALDAWVSQGGSLLLVADHYPFGLHVRSLSARFGVRMDGGYVADVEHANIASGDDGQILFQRATGGLGEHWITGPLSTVQSFTGQALHPDSGTCLLRLGAKAERFKAVATRRGDDVEVRMEPGGSAGGWCQAVAGAHGRGRVVVLGEAAMITAQVDRQDQPFGMQLSGDDNELFALQVVRWLAHGDTPGAGNTSGDGHRNRRMDNE